MDERARSLAELTDDFGAVARRLVDRTRRYSAGRWRTAASQGTVADVVEALVTTLARLEHAVEVGPADPPQHWRSPSAAPYPGALPDRLAVVSTDLVAALRAAPDDHRAWYGGALVPVDELAAAAGALTQAAADAVG